MAKARWEVWTRSTDARTSHKYDGVSEAAARRLYGVWVNATPEVMLLCDGDLVEDIHEFAK